MPGAVLPLVVAALAVFSSGPDSATTSPAAAADAFAGPSAVESPVAWNVLFRGEGAARHLAVDADRGRVLFTAFMAASFDTHLFVMDENGTVTGNVSVGPPSRPEGARIAIDPATGYAYLSGDLRGIVQVDPSGPTILAQWTYPRGLNPRAISIHAGVLYATQHSQLDGPWPIAKIDAASGAFLGNLTSLPFISSTHHVVDPNSLTLFVQLRFSVLRVSLVDGSVSELPLRTAFALSADGRRLYLCVNEISGTSSRWRFGSLSLATGLVAYYLDDCHLSSMAPNPVTDAVAFGSLEIGNETNWIGRIETGVPSDSLIDLGWTGDGKVLFGILQRTPLDAFEVGAWTGRPWLVLDPGLPRVIVPGWVCRDFQSVSGLDWTSIETSLDGRVAPHKPWTPGAQEICVDASALPDGDHLLRIASSDALGQSMDEVVAFATDGTPPAIAIVSSTETAVVPYALKGTLTEVPFRGVNVNGVAASLDGLNWSLVIPRMQIGANRFVISVADEAGNQDETTSEVRFWPPFLERIANATGRFSVSVPPGWTYIPMTALGRAAGVGLLGPTESPVPVYITVVAIHDSRAIADPDYALHRAEELQASIEAAGGFILEAARSTTAANHPAATITALTSLSGVYHRDIRTIIVAAEWKLAITVTGSIPWTTWANHTDDMTWIIEGLRIDPAPDSRPEADDAFAWATWLVLGIASAAGLGIAVAVAWGSRKRDGRNRS